MTVSRREFLKTSAAIGAGLTIAVSLEGCGPEALPGSGGAPFAPNAWIRVGKDGIVTVLVDRSEMGQGVSTSLPMLVAEELDADWSKVRYEYAPANDAYANPTLPFKAQLTGGSSAIRGAWRPLREAGAKARAMLVAAAAAQWNVSAGECQTENGSVVHTGSGRQAEYGSLAEQAGQLAVPANVPLKDPKTYRFIGKPIARLDLPEKVTGKATFGLDARPEGVLVAVVARCPTFGGKLQTFDAAKARAIPGVRLVAKIDSGVAVVANSYWEAKRGRDALEITWNHGPHANLSSEEITERFEQLANGEGRVARKAGDASAVLAAAPKKVDAVYSLPYLAHATMEPMNCTAHVRKDGVTLWVPTQFQSGPSFFAGGGSRGVAASIAGVPLSSVEVHTTNLGGGFGRRSELDFVAEAVQIAKLAPAPVKLIWSREDDIRHDFYRPASYHKLSAALGSDGMPIAWSHRVVAPSIMSRFLPGWLPNWMAHLAGPMKGGIDPSAVEGAADLPYAIPALEVTYAQADVGVPVGFWRSVGHSSNPFVVEGFVDELAAAVGQDPFEYRRKLLANAPRHRKVLETAAEKAGWGGPPPAGRFRGIAVHESFGSFAAEVAEVSIEAGNQVRVHRVVCAIDCGMVVNPDTIAAQIEGGIVYGLSAALKGKVTIEKGGVKQSNFHDYQVLRMSEMPVVEVYLVPSGDLPGGVGEPGTPPIAPAVANAVFAATGKRVRTLPIAL